MESSYVILCLYVDGLLIIDSNDNIIKFIKDMLNSKFYMKDMSMTNIILGTKIYRTSEQIVLSQAHYVDKILEKFRKEDYAVVRTPIDLSQHLSKNRREGISQLEYSMIIGSLMKLISSTRLKIVYVVSRLSRYMSNPGVENWKTRVLRYLRYTHDFGMHNTRYPAVIEGYNDASWTYDMKDSMSTSELVFTLGGAAIS